MKTIPQAVAFLAQYFGITPEDFTTLSQRRQDVFKKRISQMLLREVFERNATHQSIEAGYGWIETGYTDFVQQYKTAKIEFINWINN